jgi:thioredoxin-like negative regulator of GroEL
LVAVKLNAEKEGRSLVEKFRIASLPTVVVFDPASGREVSRIGGFLPTGPFVEKLRAILQMHRGLPALEKKVAQSPSDSASALALLRIYAEQGRPPEVRRLLERIRKADPNGKRGHLGPALLELGMRERASGSIGRAKPHLEEADRLVRTPQEHALARLELGICHAASERLGDAVATWKTVGSISGCPPRLKEAAATLIQRAQAMQRKR